MKHYTYGLIAGCIFIVVSLLIWLMNGLPLLDAQPSLGCLKVVPVQSSDTKNPFYRLIDLDTGQVSDTKSGLETGIVSVSPDQHYVVYSSNKDDLNNSLFVKPLKPSTKLDAGFLLRDKLPSPSGVIGGWLRDSLDVVWATDSQNFAYHWRSEPISLTSMKSVQDTLVIANVEGHTLAQRTVNISAGSHLRLEGFSNNILVSSVEEPSGTVALTMWRANELQPVIADVEVAPEGCYRDSKGELVCVHWSTDRQWLAFARTNNNQGAEVALYNLATRKLTIFSPSPERVIRDISWSPDNVRVAVVSNRSGEASENIASYSAFNAVIDFYNVDGTTDLAALSTIVKQDFYLQYVYYTSDTKWLNNGRTFFYAQLVAPGTNSSPPTFRLLAYDVNKKRIVTLVSETATALGMNPEYREFHGKYLVLGGIINGDRISTGVIDTVVGAQTVSIEGWATWWWLASEHLLFRASLDSKQLNWFRADGLKQGRLENIGNEVNYTPDGQWVLFTQILQSDKRIGLFAFNLISGQSRLLYDLDTDQHQSAPVTYTRIIPAADSRSVVFLIGTDKSTVYNFISLDHNEVTTVSLEPALPEEAIMYDSRLGSDNLRWAWSPDGAKLAIAQPLGSFTNFQLINTNGALVKQIQYGDTVQNIGAIVWGECH